MKILIDDVDRRSSRHKTQYNYLFFHLYVIVTHHGLHAVLVLDYF